jgi:hypothetical protein
MLFAIVAGIPQPGPVRLSAMGLSGQAAKGQIIGLGTPLDHRRQAQMAADINDRLDLGETPLPPPTAPAVVVGDMPTLQAGAIDGG